MANYFNIPKLNSFRWVLKNPTIDARYNTLPFDYQTATFNPNGLYSAKWQTNDKAQVQLQSDFTDVALKFYKCGSRQVYLSVGIPVVVTSLIGYSFKTYQAEVDFNDFAVGNYYGEITYTDENNNVVTYVTSPISVKEVHQRTLLYEYKHTFNTQGVIFQPTGLEFNFRVEGWIDFIDPDADNEIFVDQEHNVTLEGSIPFRKYTLWVGLSGVLVPDWVIEKVGLIFSVDQKKIDGTYYERSDAGDKFTAIRGESTKNTDAVWSISVTPNENFFLDAFNVGDNPDENDLQVITRSKQYLLNSANLVVSGTFKPFSTLVGIQIDNLDVEAFTMIVGTTLGGTQIGTFPVPTDSVSFIEINKGFNSVQDLYIGGLTGHNCNISIVYYQLDDRTAIPVSGGGGFVKGTVYMYEELSPGDFDNDWDIATGLGRSGSKYEGCALSGTNGTIDRSDMVIRGWDRSLPATRDTAVGDPDNTLVLTVGQLPPHSHGTDMYPNKAGAGHSIGGQGPDRNGSTTTSVGNGDPIDFTPFSIITAFFVKIVD